MVGEDVSGAAGVVVVRVRQPKPEHRLGCPLEPRTRVQHRHSPISLRRRLLMESQYIKGSLK